DEAFGAASSGYDVPEGFYGKKATFDHPLVVVDFADIAAAMVMEDDDDHIAFLQQMIQLQEALYGRARGIAAEKPFFAGDAAGHDGGVFVRHLLEHIDVLHVVVLRYEVLADAFRDVGVYLVHIDVPRPEIFGEEGAVGVHRPNLDLRVFLLEEFGGAGDGAARTGGYDQMGEFPVGLLPNF